MIPENGPQRGASANILRRIADAFEVTSETQRHTLQSMRRGQVDGWVVYWFLLATATGIATFGLTLSSPGVVIGAMLVAPLMGPIVELSMSLAVGDALLLARSLKRVGLSIALVIASSALIVWLLPFKSTNAEILARTSPTILDLCVAMFCALAGAFTTVRDSSSAASTAAGTSIGISLVPPLCVVGFGLGVGDVAIAEGALLLFTANFCAILLCAGLFFASVGFGFSLGPDELQREMDGLGRGVLAHLAAQIQQGLHSRWRLLWRLGVPLVLVAAVAVPLERALERMAWEVRTRNALNQIVADESGLHDAISVVTNIRQGSVSLQAVMVGDDEAAVELEQRLLPRIAAVAGFVPQVRIRAIRPNEAEQPQRIADVEPSLSESLGRFQARLDKAVRAVWPEEANQLIVDSRWQMDGRTLTVRITHQGEALPREMASEIERALSARLSLPIRLSALALSPAIAATDAELPAWWERALPLIEALDSLPEWSACVELRPPERGQALAAHVESYIGAQAAARGHERVVARRATRWSIAMMPRGQCTTEKSVH